jgi:hypothetical protein
MAGSAEKATAIAEIIAHFDVVIESSKAGVRKPDPRIYLMMCEAAGSRRSLRLSRRPGGQLQAGGGPGHDRYQGLRPRTNCWPTLRATGLAF